MSRDLRGFSFPVLVTFQSVKRKHAGELLFSGLQIVFAQRRNLDPAKQKMVQSAGSAGNRGRALRSLEGPVSSSPNLTLKGVGAGGCLFSPPLMLLLAVSLPLLATSALLLHPFLVSSGATTKSEDFS